MPVPPGSASRVVDSDIVSSMAPSSPVTSPRTGGALSRTQLEKEMHLHAARHLPGQRPERELRSLFDWLRRRHTCLVLEHFTKGGEDGEQLLSKARHVAFEKGAVIYKQLDCSGTGAYIIVDGEVSLFAPEGTEKECGEAHWNKVCLAKSKQARKGNPFLPRSQPSSPMREKALDFEGKNTALCAMNGLISQSSPTPLRRRKPSLLRSMTIGADISREERSTEIEAGLECLQLGEKLQIGHAIEGSEGEPEHGVKFATLAEGESFGEMSLVRGRRPRAATAVAETNVELLIVCPDLAKEVASGIKVKNLEEKVDTLESNATFKKWRWMALAQLASYMNEVQVLMETQVVRQHESVSKVYFIKSGQFRIQSLEKAEVGEEQVAGSSTVHRQEVRALAKTGSSNRLELPSQGSSQDLLHKEAALSYRFNRLKDVTTLGTGDILGAYEVSKGIASYSFGAQAMENSVVFEMSARKFLSTVKKYSRPSLTELADDYMHRFGLAPRMRKRSGSCPDLWALHQKGSDRKGRLGIIRAGAHLPPLSPKSRPRLPVVAVSGSLPCSLPGSPHLSRAGSAASSSFSTPGTGTPKLPPLNSSRPESPLMSQRSLPTSPVNASQLSNLLGEVAAGSPTVVRHCQSPASKRKAAGRFDQVSYGSGNTSPLTRRAHIRGGTV